MRRTLVVALALVVGAFGLGPPAATGQPAPGRAPQAQAASAASQQAPAGTIPNQPGPAPVLGEGSPGAIPDEYIVVLDHGVGVQANDAVAGLATSHGGTVSRRYSSLFTGFAAKLPPKAVAALREHEQVRYIEAVVKNEAAGDQPNPAPWGLDRIDQRYLPEDDHYHYDSDGAGVTVYVVDSGVRVTHAEFGGRAVDGYDAFDRDWVAEDCTGHGTHVAGTVGGRTTGVAKAARIVAVRVLGCHGGDSAISTNGLDWVDDNAAGPSIVNFSVGSLVHSTALEEAIRVLVAHGHVVVVAAGNANVDACGVSPARVSEAITVGGVDRNDYRASISNWGGCLDLFAPGVDIWSASHHNDTDLNHRSGTSMAAPHVAGVAAMYRQRYPGSSPHQVRDALVNQATRDVVLLPNWSPNRLLFAHRLPPGTATPTPGLNAVFNSYGDSAGCATWSGADGTHSVRLPSGKIAWFFADTYLGSPALRANAFDISFVRNSIVVQSGSSLRTITGGNTCRERDQSLPFWDRYAHTSVDEPGSNAFYWPNEGKVVGTNVVKFYYRNIPTPDGWWTDTHTAVVTIPISQLENNTVINPTPVLMAPHHIYGGHPINWGSALLDHGGWTYIYGAGIVDAWSNRRLFLARTSPGNLANPATWQYNLGGGRDAWSAPGHQAAAQPVSTEFFVGNGFGVTAANGAFWLVQHDVNLNGGNINAHAASTPWNFDARRILLYTPPEGPRDAAHKYQFYYEARLSEPYSTPSRISMSYNVNSSSVSVGCRARTDHDAAIYRPRFVDFPVTMLRAADATKYDFSLSGFATASTASAKGQRGDPAMHELRGVWAGRPSQPPDGTRPAQAAGGEAGINAADYSWYDKWSGSVVSNGGCPVLNQPSSLSGSARPDGTVHLYWSDYGRDMWYWVHTRNVTRNEPFTRSLYWVTGRSVMAGAVTDTSNNGHTFEFYIVPWANAAPGVDKNGDGRLDNEAPASNTVRIVARVQPPAAPANVVARNTGSGIEVTWSGVTYPSSSVYYWVYYWNVDGLEPVDAHRFGPFDQHSRAAQFPIGIPGNLYGFRVRAENIGGLSPPSSSSYARR
jgi:subtilisin family serine protease